MKSYSPIEYLVVVIMCLVGAYFLYEALLPLVDLSEKTAEAIKSAGL